ncbi:hypothetical protein FACS189455_0960 [Bacteroidia bacterium]|nr:hypothetical protein FACS189455_0960 [Bacteroidia bacterium]
MKIRKTYRTLLYMLLLVTGLSGSVSGQSSLIPPKSGSAVYQSGGTLTLSNSVVWENVFIGSNVANSDGTSLLEDTDPEFLSGSDFHVSLSSPARGKGERSKNPLDYTLDGWKYNSTQIYAGAYGTSLTRLVILGDPNAVVRVFTDPDATAASEVQTGHMIPSGTLLYFVAYSHPGYKLEQALVNGIEYTNLSMPYRASSGVVEVGLKVSQKQAAVSYGVFATASSGLTLSNTITYDNLHDGFNNVYDGTNLVDEDPVFEEPEATAGSFRHFTLDGTSSPAGVMGKYSLNPLLHDISGHVFPAGKDTIASGAYYVAGPEPFYRLHVNSLSNGSFRLSMVDLEGKWLSYVLATDTTLAANSRLQVEVIPASGYALTSPVSLGNGQWIGTPSSSPVSGGISGYPNITQYPTRGTVTVNLDIDLSAQLGQSSYAVSNSLNVENCIVYDNITVAGVPEDRNWTLEDPSFAQPGAAEIDTEFFRHWNLLSISGAINAGNEAVSGLPTLDIAGVKRVAGYSVDMGAYEGLSSSMLLFDKVYDPYDGISYVNLKVTCETHPGETIVSGTPLADGKHSFLLDFKSDRTSGLQAYDVKLNNVSLNGLKGITNLSNKSLDYIVSQGGELSFEPTAEVTEITYRVSAPRLNFTPEYRQATDLPVYAGVSVKNTSGEVALETGDPLPGVPGVHIDVDIKDPAYNIDCVRYNNDTIAYRPSTGVTRFTVASLPDSLIINTVSVSFLRGLYKLTLKETDGLLKVTNAVTNKRVYDGDSIPSGTRLIVSGHAYGSGRVSKFILNGETALEDGQVIVVSGNTLIELFCSEITENVVRFRAENAGIVVTNKDAGDVPINSGDVLPIGTNLKVEITPNPGHEFGFINAYGMSVSNGGSLGTQSTSDAFDIEAFARPRGEYRIRVEQPFSGRIEMKNELGAVISDGTFVPRGSLILVKLTPEAYYRFGRLVINGAEYSESEVTYLVEEDTEITGVCNPESMWTLSLSSQGSGTLVVIDRDNVPFVDGSYILDEHDLHITATPASGDAYIYVNDVPFTSGGKYTVTGNTKVTAYFTSSSGIYPVNMKSENGSFTVTNASSGAVVNSGDEVASSTVLNVVFTPREGYVQKSLTLNGSDFTTASLTVGSSVLLHGKAGMEFFTVKGKVSGLDTNAGVEIRYSLDKATAQKVTTDAGGNYTIFNIPAQGGVDIYPPVVGGKDVSPESYKDVLVGRDKSELNFVYSNTVLTSWVLSGKVTRDGTEAPGIVVDYVQDGISKTTVSGSDGVYRISAVTSSQVKITPSIQGGYTVSPAEYDRTGGVTASESNLDIAYTLKPGTAYNAKGRVTGLRAEQLVGKTVSYTINSGQSTGVATIQSDGSYLIEGLSDGETVTVTPTQVLGYTASSVSGTVSSTTLILPDIAYAAKPGWSLSGTVSGLTNNSGITVSYTLDNGAVQTVTTDGSGNYTVSSIADGANIVLTPDPQTGYTFAPGEIKDRVTANLTGRDFAYTANSISTTFYSVTGSVTGLPVVSGLKVSYTLNGESSFTSTDPSGNYTIPGIPKGTDVVLTPALNSGYVVTPGSYSYVNLSENKTADFAYASQPTGTTYLVGGLLQGLASGQASGLEITYTVTGFGRGTVYSNAQGEYVISGLPDGSRLVLEAPAVSGYTTPVNRTLTLSGSNRQSEHFIYTPVSNRETDIAGAGISLEPDPLPRLIYTGSAVQHAPGVIKVNDSGTLLTEGVDYRLVYSNNTGVGNGVLEVVGMGSYAGKKTLTFSIAASGSLNDISNAQVIPGELEDRLYTGFPLTYSPGYFTLSYNGTPMTEGVDYSVSYGNNVEAGTASVYFTGTGSYIGTKSLTFTIANPNAPVILKDLEDAIICIGGSHTFAVEAEGHNLTYEWYCGNNRIWGVNGNTCTVTNAKLKDYERYYVIVRSNFESFSSSTYSRNVLLWVTEELPESLHFSEYPNPAETGRSYHIKLAGYSDVTKYTWSYDREGVTFAPSEGGVGENETWASFGKLSEGTGMLTVTLDHPCGTRQATRSIRVVFPTGTGSVSETGLRVFPNPADGIIHVSNTRAGQTVRILDAAGLLKGSYPTREGTTSIDLTGYAKGAYMLLYNGKTFKVIRK